jgi:hypothetical protein
MAGFFPLRVNLMPNSPTFRLVRKPRAIRRQETAMG